jgi:peptidyl-prolyl cis-trans isomerase C
MQGTEYNNGMSMIIGRHILIVLVLCALLPQQGIAQKRAVLPSDTVARIGQTVITARDLLLRLELMPFPAKQTKAEAETLKSKALYALIAEKVLAHAAARQGIGEDEKTGLMKRELENVFVRDELYKREIVAHAAPSRQEVAEGIARIVKEVQVLSFLVRSESEGASLALMLRTCKPDSVLQKIPRSFYTQADTIMVRFGAADTAYENAAYAIDKSRVSRVFSSSNFGWAVLYLLDKRTYKPAVELALPDRQRRVEQTLQGRHEQELVGTYSFQVLKSRRALADSLLFQALADSISSLWKEDTAHFKSHGRFILTSDLVDLMMVRMKPMMGSTFVTIDDGNLSLADVLEMFRYLDFTSGTCEGDPFRLELNDAVKDLVAKELLVREGRRQGLQNTRDVRNDLQLWTDSWAARSLYYRVRDSISVSDEDILRHLLKNNLYFGHSYQVNVREILTANLSDIAKVYDEMKRGRSLDALAKQYSMRTEWAGRGGESGFFDVAEHPEIGFRALMADTSLLIGPVKLADGYSVFKVLGKRNSTRARTTFDTLRSNVQRRLLTEKRKEILDGYVAEQAREQRVVIDHNKLRRIPYTQVPMFSRRFIGFGGRMAATPLLMQMWDWIKQFQQPPSIFP